jgi:hypothetical protein
MRRAPRPPVNPAVIQMLTPQFEAKELADGEQLTPPPPEPPRPLPQPFRPPPPDWEQEERERRAREREEDIDKASALLEEDQQ